jgi:peptidoglycan/xylan/chitin deacetylase (PgdA/CDA1 family)
MQRNRKRERLLRSGAWLGAMAAAAAISSTIWLSLDPVVSVPLGLGVLGLAAAVGDRWMRCEGGVAILNYHSVSGDQRWLDWVGPISVTPETFARQLDLLRRLGCTILSTSALVIARRNCTPLPPRSVVIHFDDGYLDNWVAAYPILRRHQAPATIFVLVDFIDPELAPRPSLDDVAARRCKAGDLRWDGYLNLGELQALQGSGLVDVEAHGTDHSHVDTGPEATAEITSENWRQLSCLQWRAMTGCRAEWHRCAVPPALPLGTPVRPHAPALAAHAWLGDRLETDAEYRERVRTILRRSRLALGRVLGREISIFCWPENQTTPVARALAHEVGFLATTAGIGENRADEPWQILSRWSVTEGILGWRSAWLDDLWFRANVRLFQGNYYWYGIVALLLVGQRLSFALRRTRAVDRPVALGWPRRRSLVSRLRRANADPGA